MLDMILMILMNMYRLCDRKLDSAGDAETEMRYFFALHTVSRAVVTCNIGKEKRTYGWVIINRQRVGETIRLRGQVRQHQRKTSLMHHEHNRQ
jgi:hypothetical protein